MNQARGSVTNQEPQCELDLRSAPHFGGSRSLRGTSFCPFIHCESSTRVGKKPKEPEDARQQLDDDYFGSVLLYSQCLLGFLKEGIFFFLED